MTKDSKNVKYIVKEAQDIFKPPVDVRDVTYDDQHMCQGMAHFAWVKRKRYVFVCSESNAEQVMKLAEWGMPVDVLIHWDLAADWDQFSKRFGLFAAAWGKEYDSVTEDQEKMAFAVSDS